jgi:asparagine synthase (glutamine-hydrolysing)
VSAVLLLVFHPAPPPPGLDERFSRVEAALPDRVRGFESDRRGSRHCMVSVWSHDASRSRGFADDERSGSWLAVVGNPARADLREHEGDDLLGRLLGECLEAGPACLETLSPPFAAVYHDGRSGTTHLQVDRSGIQHVYLAESGRETWLSSSSLALAALGGRGVDVDGAAEWLAVGHFLSDRTLVEGVSKLGPGQRVTARSGRVAVGARWAPDRAPIAAGEDAFRTRLLASLDSVAPDGPLAERTAAELTGGLDSRLTLAGLLALRKRFLAWTLGGPESSEVRTIARLRERAAFAHVCVPVDEAQLAGDADGLVRELHALSDGEVNALGYAPLLVAFAALEGRRTTSIAGTGGEIARGFYYRVLRAGESRHRGVPVGALARRLSAATGGVRHGLRPELVQDPDALLEDTVRSLVDASPGTGPEAVLDDVYLRARMQRFAGRNATTTGLFCRQALPYFENHLVDTMLALPASAKRNGLAARRTLARIDRALASVPLESGVPAWPPSLRRPDVRVRQALALGRKALARYGGEAGRALARTAPGVVDWRALARRPSFRELVSDTLLARDARVLALLEAGSVKRTVESGLTSGDLYPIGLLLTLEHTLETLERHRRSSAAARSAARLAARSRS